MWSSRTIKPRVKLLLVVTILLILFTLLYIDKLKLFSFNHSTSFPSSVHQSFPSYGTSASKESVKQSANLPLDILSWTSLNNDTHGDTHFFSAYFDGRKQTPNSRPTVIIFGYHMDAINPITLYCLFTYSNGTTHCLANPVEQIKPCTKVLSYKNFTANGYHYKCKLKCSECHEEEIPTFVAISNMSNCKHSSAWIPVRNRLKSSIKSVGICVESPVYHEARNLVTLQEIAQFVEMNRALGAEIIHLYVMDMDKSLLQILLEKYSKEGILQLIKWRKFERWSPLHYYGQALLIHDCLYRNMHRVKHLLFIDLDEIILPLQHNSFTEMINYIGQQDQYSSYVFGNCYYQQSPNLSYESSTLANCTGIHIPKYFQWTKKRLCMCNDENFKIRTKYIVVTERVIDTNIHKVCNMTSGREYHVPHKVALLAHYRKSPDHCESKESIQDNTTLKFQSQVIQSLKKRFC